MDKLISSRMYSEKYNFLKLLILSFPPWPSFFHRYSTDIPDVVLAICSAITQHTGWVWILLHHIQCITSRDVMSIWHTNQQFDTETNTVFFMCVVYYIPTAGNHMRDIFICSCLWSRNVVYGSYWGVHCSVSDTPVLFMEIPGQRYWALETEATIVRQGE